MRGPTESTIGQVRQRHQALWVAWQRSGLTQKEFAGTLHMSPQKFNMLLNLGRIPDPLRFTLEQQRALYNWTGMLPEELWPSETVEETAKLAPEILAATGFLQLPPTPEEAVERRDYGRCAQRMLRQLPAFDARIVEQHLIAGKSFRELGEALALTAAAIEQHFQRAIRELRAHPQECCA